MKDRTHKPINILKSAPTQAVWDMTSLKRALWLWPMMKGYKGEFKFAHKEGIDLEPASKCS